MTIRLENAPTTAPAITPVTLLEVKYQLRLTSEDFSDDIASTISIAPGDHVIAASYSLLGTGVDVLGKDAMVLFTAGTNGEGGTVTVKVQESDDNSTYTEVSTFTAVTTANDNASYEYLYTGSKQYLRAVATVAGATCDFGVSIVTNEPTAGDEDLLSFILNAVVDYMQMACLGGRALITQTWTAWLDEWPEEDYIELPMGPLQTVTSITYYDTDGTANTFSSGDYAIDDINDHVHLEYGESWPGTTLRDYKAIEIIYAGGYGDAASDVPNPIKQAILRLACEWYQNREDMVIGQAVGRVPWVDSLLANYRRRVF